MKHIDNMGTSEHQLKNNGNGNDRDKEPAELREVASARSYHEKEEHPDVPDFLPMDSRVNNIQQVDAKPMNSVISLGGKIRRRTIFSIDSNEKLDNNVNPEHPQKVEIKKIDIEQILPVIQPAISRPQGAIQCNFCAELLQQDKFEKMFKCGHKFCKDCMKIYVENQMKNFRIVKCPSEQCNGQLDQQSDYFKGLGAEIKQKYQIIKFRTQIEKNQKLALCPDQNCKKGYIQIKEGSKTGECKQCHVVYCLKCKMKSHHGKCQKFQDILLKDKFKYKKCQGCKRIVERNQGCPHMTCKCGFQFCYYCAGKWDVPHRCLRYLAGGQLVTDKLYDGLKCLRHEDYEYEYTFVGFITKVPFYIVVLLLLILYFAWCVAAFALFIAGILIGSFFSGYVAFLYKLCRDGNIGGKICAIVFIILLPLGFIVGWVVVCVYCIGNGIPKFMQLALSARLFPCYLCS